MSYNLIIYRINVELAKMVDKTNGKKDGAKS